MIQSNPKSRFALCVENKDSEDYLYPASYFILVELPAEAQEALRVAG